MRAVRQQAAMLPMLATAIAGWERRLAPLSKAVRPMAPPGELWLRIEDAIGPPAVPAPPLLPLDEVAKELDPTPRFTVTPRREAEPVQWPDDPPVAREPEPVRWPAEPPAPAPVPEPSQEVIPDAWPEDPPDLPTLPPEPVSWPEERLISSFRPPEPPVAREPEQEPEPVRRPDDSLPGLIRPAEAPYSRSSEPVQWPEERPIPTLRGLDRVRYQSDDEEQPLRPRGFRSVPADDVRAQERSAREAVLRDFDPGEPPTPEAANDAGEAQPARRAVWPWQFTTVASLAFAAGIAAFVLVPGLAPDAQKQLLGARYTPQIAAMLPTDGHAAGFLVEARSDGTVLLSALAPVQVPPGKALELWMLPPGQTVPKSLGVFPADGTRLALPSVPPNGTTLMVSLEPSSGAPGGKPSGPVLFEGHLQQMPL
jgi:anti-sigma-K factor RskA